MSIELAVLLATPAVGALWAGALGINALIKDIHQRHRIAQHLDAVLGPRMPDLPTGRHRLVETGRHHLRRTPAHVG